MGEAKFAENFVVVVPAGLAMGAVVLPGRVEMDAQSRVRNVYCFYF